MDMKPINWEMIKQPFNWLIVLIMILFAGLAIELLMKYFNIINVNPINNNQEVL